MDSTAAYINALIDSLVYVYDLQFHKDLDKKLNINISSDKRPIYKLTRNLYGLARGSSLWQTFITTFFVQNDFEEANNIFKLQNEEVNIILGLYVDDGMILYKNLSDLTYLKNLLHKFEIKWNETDYDDLGILRLDIAKDSINIKKEKDILSLKDIIGLRNSDNIEVRIIKNAKLPHISNYYINSNELTPLNYDTGNFYRTTIFLVIVTQNMKVKKLG